MAPEPPAYHAFDSLVLTISESGMEGVSTDHRFELRSTGEGKAGSAGTRAAGAEVWRSSVLYANGDSCASGERFVGWLTARQVIELLVEIERSGVYEALPTIGIVAGAVDTGQPAPLVSMQLRSSEHKRDVLRHVPADEVAASDVVRAVRDAVALAQERALCFAG